MSIVLRNLKGSALTYTEMDRNQSQFFYSASLADGGGTLKLYYTGSSLLNDVDGTSYAPRSVDISIGGGGATGVTQLVAGTNITLTNSAGQPSSGTGVVTINAAGGGEGGVTTPGGSNTNIQFNDGGSFGGDNLFVYDKTNDFVGIGTTSGMTRRLHINDDSNGGAIIRLQSNTTTNANKQAFLEIGKGSSDLTQIGKLNGNSNDTYIHHLLQPSTVQTGPIIGKTHFSFTNIGSITATITDVGIGIGTTGPTRDLSINSDSNKGIGISTAAGRSPENRIRILPNDVWTRTFVDNSNNSLLVTKYGLGIHTPVDGSDGGNMLIAISDTSAGITEERDPHRLLITSYNSVNTDDSLNTAPVHIASFTAAGRVGIHTPDPNQDIRLDINGQYRGAYLEQEDDYTLDFKNYSVIKVTDTVGGGTTLGITGNVPPAGTKAVLILEVGTKAVDLQLLATTNLISNTNLETQPNKHSTITFVSDGTNLIETSRTVDMA